MADESNTLASSRVVRWAVIGVLIGVSIAFYFLAGTRLATITASAQGASADSAR